MKSRFASVHPGLILAATCGAVVLASADGRAQDDRPLFVRGDVDGDGRLTITDAVGTLRLLFRGEGVACAAAADLDDNGRVELTDVIVLLNFLFGRGQRPPFPFPLCGADPTPGDLPCAISETTCPATLSIFGEPIAADNVFFAVDRSGSMVPEGRLETAKEALLDTVSEMRSPVRFAVVFFDALLRRGARFPAEGLTIATEKTKNQAEEFIRDMPLGGGGCPREALLHGLETLEAAPGGRNVLVYLGDTGVGCVGFGGDSSAYLEDMVASVTGENRTGVQIYAFGILPPLGEGRTRFAELAGANGGRYIEVRRRADAPR